MSAGGRRDDGVRGVFIPADVLVISAIVAIGVVMATLAALFPAIGLPVGVGTAVTGLLYGIYRNTRGRRSPDGERPKPIDQGDERHG